MKLLTLFVLSLCYFSSFALPYAKNVNNPDEDALLTVPELIVKYGYPAEEHHVTTPDGYILTLHRIPHGRNSTTVSNKVVLIQHGLLSSSADFVITGVDHALGYTLAEAGYDVWMGNARGNRLSRNHTTLDPDTSAEFWQFSWHQTGAIDFPAMIDYILDITGQEQLFHIGHSQGTTNFYVMGSTRPEYNQKVKAHFSMAPIAFLEHMTSPLLRLIATWTGPLEELLNLLGWNEFLPESDFYAYAGDLFCRDDEITQILCKNVFFIICGYSPNEINGTMLPAFLGHTPAGASTKQVIHYGQEVLSGHFRQFDFGEKNQEVYGAPEPPDYDLSAVTAPVYLFYSNNDWLANVTDVMRLADNLGNCAGKILVEEQTFNHVDYMLGIRAKELVYDKIISIMNTY